MIQVVLLSSPSGLLQFTACCRLALDCVGARCSAVLAEGETSVPCRSVLSTAGPAPAWPDQRRAAPPSTSSEADMTVEAATQLVLEGAMQWPYKA